MDLIQRDNFAIAKKSSLRRMLRQYIIVVNCTDPGELATAPSNPDDLLAILCGIRNSMEVAN